jgi:hypothetical protein
MAGAAMASRSLYYPYIHIRDPNWLKTTLLLFSEVRRMTPIRGLQPGDSEAIKPFTQRHGGREPMLRSANLWSGRAVAAQVELARRLREDAKDLDFMNRFGQYATEAMRGTDDLGFQIHQAKLHESLREVLSYTGLAWDPQTRHPYDRAEYVELNERLGQAIMSTLAIACATGEGLDIVGDKRSGPLHDCLAKKRIEDVYDTWLKPANAISDPIRPDARELFEFVVTFACDTTNLDVENLANMGSNREPIHRLMEALADRAKKMDAMDPSEDRQQKFEDETRKILKDWKADRNNMDNFWKRFFGFGLVEKGGTFFEKIIGKAAEAMPTAGTGTLGAFAGLALHGPLLLAAGAGLGIGLITHGAKTYADVRKTERDSPYRYLTLMEEAGVVIRADLLDRSTEAKSEPKRSAEARPEQIGRIVARRKLKKLKAKRSGVVRPRKKK